MSSRSYKSRSPSYSSSTVKSPSLARRSLYEPRSVSPSPALQSTPRSASITNGDIERSPVSRALPPRIISDLCIPKAGAAGGSSAVNGLPPPSHRRSSATLSPAALSSVGSASINVPPALASSLSNSVKYERCYNDLLSRINHIKVETRSADPSTCVCFHLAPTIFYVCKLQPGTIVCFSAGPYPGGKSSNSDVPGEVVDTSNFRSPPRKIKPDPLAPLNTALSLSVVLPNHINLCLSIPSLNFCVLSVPYVPVNTNVFPALEISACSGLEP